MNAMLNPWKDKNSGIYYHLVKVPVDIQKALGKTVIKKSLRTRDNAEAKRLFALMYADTCALFIQARNKVKPL